MDLTRYASFFLLVATSLGLATGEVYAQNPAPKPSQTLQEEPSAPPAESLPFLVTVQTQEHASIIDFPWQKRTAATIFQRPNAIWIVFSTETWVDAARVATVLPPTIRSITQYRVNGATVLRLTTDGTVYANAISSSKSYGWQVRLSHQPPKPEKDIPITVVIEGGKPQLQLSAYDVAPAIRFFDPILQDQLIIVPSYSAGEGVASARNYQGIQLLATQQGVAWVADREDATVTNSREGVVLSTQNPLPASQRLPLLSSESAPITGVSATANVMLPYDRWFIPKHVLTAERQLRTRNLSNATPDAIPSALTRMMQMYLGRGMFHEALGYLNLLKTAYPEYYTQQKMALLRGVCHTMMQRLEEAHADVMAPELDGMEEAQLWRDVVASLNQTLSLMSRVQSESVFLEEDTATTASPPSPNFDYLHYDEAYIRYYPPVIRQRLAMIGAESYLHRENAEKSLKIYDGLSRDGILKPVQLHAEYALARVASSKNKRTEALEIYARLGQQFADPFIRARARMAAALLRYKEQKISPDETTNVLESLRPAWKGDGFERENLYILGKIYRDNKRYAEAIRTWKYMLDAFPDDPEILTLSGDMTSLFEKLFLDGMADTLPPLTSLALFYEFRELTPVGAKGDLMIQKLADRLAAVDLLDQAAQLLEHQVRNRLTSEDRARVGARLALIYLLNQQPQKALNAIGSSAYGGIAPALAAQRTQLTAQALNALGKYEDALSILFQDKTTEGELLRLEILWTMKDWPNVINQAEDMLATRENLTAKLSTQETEILLRLALAYSFEGDTTQMRYLRDYYGELITPSRYKDIFDFITNDTAPLDTEDQALITQQITNTRGFLEKFRDQIAQGQLSEAVK